MKGNWTWTGRYILVLVTALVMGGIISQLSPFQHTTLATSKLTAATLVKFLGYSGALAMFWMLCQRSAEQLRVSAGRAAFVGEILIPLATLIVVSSAYHVLLLVLRPFFDAGLQNIYNWLFVLGITVSALWVVTALFHHSEPLMDLFKSELANRARTASVSCGKCGITLNNGSKYCHGCGSPAA